MTDFGNVAALWARECTLYISGGVEKSELVQVVGMPASFQI